MPGRLGDGQAPRDRPARPRNPIPTVDVIIEYRGGIVLVERRNPPHGWALPGGFIDYGESAESAAVREAREETGLDLSGLKQFHTYSDPGRDCRFHTMTTVFVARGVGELVASDDAKDAAVFATDRLPEQMAFDHRQIIADYAEGAWCSGGESRTLGTAGP
jgi:ADP-ribose pyrophosphatase YjhB (NUDIX family)